MDEQLHLLTGAYALNALNPDERTALERHALANEDSREEVRGLSETAALLAYGTPAVAPPPELKDSVMAAIRNTRQLPADAVVVDLGPSRSGSASRRASAGVRQGTAGHQSSSGNRRAVRWLSAAAGILVVATAALGGWALGLAQDQDRSAQQLQAQARQQAEVMSVLTAPDSKVIPGQLPDGAVVTIAVSAQADKAAVIAQGLPELDQDRTYELWLISDDGAAPAGLMSAEAPGQTSMHLLDGISGATHVGITVEPAGGSPQPTTDPIMVQKL
jgi:anti-sigma-K factor RskA